MQCADSFKNNTEAFKALLAKIDSETLTEICAQGEYYNNILIRVMSQLLLDGDGQSFSNASENLQEGSIGALINALGRDNMINILCDPNNKIDPNLLNNRRNSLEIVKKLVGGLLEFSKTDQDHKQTKQSGQEVLNDLDKTLYYYLLKQRFPQCAKSLNYSSLNIINLGKDSTEHHVPKHLLHQLNVTNNKYDLSDQAFGAVKRAAEIAKNAMSQELN